MLFNPVSVSCAASLALRVAGFALLLAAGTALGAAAPPSPDSTGAGAADGRLAAVLAAQEPEVQARYGARHPAETLAFFQIQPGMAVVEALPEGGWYSKILHHYLGPDGTLIGVDYALDMYPLFNYYSDSELADKVDWAERWPDEVANWPDKGAAAAAFNFGSMPEALAGSADAVLFIRALHNLSVFEARGNYLTVALADALRVLKPGGVVGVVQHMGPESASDSWSSGDNGYLKKSDVIGAFEQAGFVFEAESSINENPADRPAEDEYVWRLPPASESAGDPKLDARYAAIGESNRMTLRFRKPR